MHQRHPRVRQRTARLVAAAALAASALLPAAAHGADKVVLRIGTVQDLDSLNPYQTLLVVGYESFQLTYNLMVDFGPNLEPVPGFADKWERAADGKSWTFHIRDGMTWSDGTPATAADACFSWGLAVEAIKAESNIGAGYLDPGLKDAGVTKVECPDDHTLIATTSDASNRILQTYLPIIPRHLWGKETWETIGDAKFEGALVGTGPYTAVEWKTGEYVRFARNPRYWGTQGYADEIVIQFFKGGDTMVQALKANEIDYARNPNPDELKALSGQPGITTVVGSANGWTQLAFNTYGTGTGKEIKGGGPSTKALLDPAFRDAIGYAIDKKALVERVLGGFGDPGDTIVPPVLGNLHVAPTTPRTFDMALAKQKLDAGGYLLNGNGQRLDKEGKPISLRLVMPDTDVKYRDTAQFVVQWYGELGIKVTPQVLDQATLGDLVLPPEAGDAKYKANYDIELWGWSGNPDPNALMQIFRCDAIGSSSDSQYCNPDFDALYDQQTNAATLDERIAILGRMQNLIYDQAPYDILFYDANLAAYRTDKFGGWVNQPANGTPLFTYSTLGYTTLTNAAATPTPAPTAPPTEPPTAAPSSGSAGQSQAPGSTPAPTAPAATAAPAPTPAPAATPAPAGTSGASSSGGVPVALLLGVGGLVVVVGAVVLVARRNRREEDEDE